MTSPSPIVAKKFTGRGVVTIQCYIEILCNKHSQSFCFFRFAYYTTVASPKLVVTRVSQSIMSDTCIKLGEHGARVLIEDKEIPHYAPHVDQAKKEVTCWIPSEEGKVRESLFAIEILFISSNSRSFQLNG